MYECMSARWHCESRTTTESAFEEQSDVPDAAPFASEKSNEETSPSKRPTAVGMESYCHHSLSKAGPATHI